MPLFKATLDDGSVVTTALDLAVGGGVDITGDVAVTEGIVVQGASTINDTLAVTSTLTVSGGVAASGANANDFSGGSGTFLTSTGANTLSGAVTVNAATTPSITTAAGKTNTGFLTISGKTSGGFKITTADATGQTVTATLAAQTVGAAALTIPDFASVADEFVFKTKSVTLANKTLTAPVINGATTAVAANNFDFSTGTGTFKTPTGINTIGGELDLVAGGLTTAPIKFATGTNMTTATAGVLEYDGSIFYATPLATVRSLLTAKQFSIVPAGDFNLQTTLGVQSAFPTTGDVWTLAATTSYFFEGVYYITHTTTTCTVALAFPTGGSITSIGYKVSSVINAADGAPAAPVSTWVDQIASTVVTATSTVGWMIEFKGILRMNGGGTITPQINFSANTTVPVMKANSYITFTPFGTNTAAILGNVA